MLIHLMRLCNNPMITWKICIGFIQTKLNLRYQEGGKKNRVKNTTDWWHKHYQQQREYLCLCFFIMDVQCLEDNNCKQNIKISIAITYQVNNTIYNKSMIIFFSSCIGKSLKWSSISVTPIAMQSSRGGFKKLLGLMTKCAFKYDQTYLFRLMWKQYL